MVATGEAANRKGPAARKNPAARRLRKSRALKNDCSDDNREGFQGENTGVPPRKSDRSIEGSPMSKQTPKGKKQSARNEKSESLPSLNAQDHAEDVDGKRLPDYNDKELIPDVFRTSGRVGTDDPDFRPWWMPRQRNKL